MKKIVWLSCLLAAAAVNGEAFREVERHSIRTEEEPVNFCFAHRWPDGEIWVGHSLGRHRETEHLGLMFSPDNGETWRLNTSPAYAINCFLGKDGSKRTVNCWDYEKPSKEHVLTLYVFRDGIKQTRKTTVTLPWVSWFCAHRDVLRTKDGRLLLTAWGKREGDAKYNSFIVESCDDGLTWKFLSMFPYEAERNHHEGLNESSLVELKDGRILGFVRTGFSLDGKKRNPLLQFASRDGGKTWGDRREIADNGVAPQAQLLADGTLVVLSGRPGVYLLIDRSGTGERYERQEVSKTLGSSYSSLMETAPGKLVLLYDESAFVHLPGETPRNRMMMVRYEYTPAGCGETMTVDLLPGECWWGGTVGGGWKMPLDDKSDYEKDLRVDSDGNQAAPLLLSTKGRWVWCEDAFKYTVRHGRLTIVTGPAPRRDGPAPDPMDVIAAETGAPGTVPRSAAALSVPNIALTCYSKKQFAPIQFGQEKVGTLRAAFEHCSKTYFPAKGTPRLEFFRQPILNTWVELNYNQNEKDVLAYARSFLDNGMKPGVFMIDCFWQTDAYGPWRFHGDRFRDPKGLVKKMNDLGFHMMLWFAPFVTMDTMVYRQLRENNGILKDARMKPYGKGYQGLPVQWWDGLSASWDPTSPYGRAWCEKTMKRLMDDYGIEGFFFDGGDPDIYPPGEYAAWRKDAQPTDLCRAFQSMGLKVPFQQLREAWKLGGEPMMNTLRDKEPKWSEMARCVKDMIAAGQLGYPFVVADLVGGGTCGNNGDGVHGLAWQDELFVRHLQIQCLSPMIQFSGSPWRVQSPGAQQIVRDTLRLRERFAPKIEAIAVETGRTGLPMLRSMDFQFPNCGYERVLDQFMMGDDLLVVPVVEGGVKTRKVVIPAGTWRGDDGTSVTGPKTIEVETPLSRLPYFERLQAGS
jgi:alpha-glucosidase